MTGRAESDWQWRWNDPELHTVLEVYQGARGSYEGPSLPYQALDLDPYAARRASVGRGLARGLDFGLIAASDHAASSNGLAGVYADEVTREAVFDALASRETFAATDFLRVDASLGELRPGGAGGATRDAPFVVRARGPAPVAAVEIVKNGEPWEYHDGVPGTELLVLTTRRWGPYPDRPLVLSTRDARLVGVLLRGRGETEATLELLDDGSLALSKRREPLDLVLEIAPTGDAAALVLALGDESLAVPLASLEPGRSRTLEPPVDREQLWRVGPSLGVEELLLSLPDPDRKAGDSYYARVVFEDGNLAWTSPIRVTGILEEPR